MNARTEQAKQRRATRLAAGLCRDCNSPVAPGKTMCEQHLATMRRRQNSERERRQLAGLCTNCGGPREEEDFAYCRSCRDPLNQSQYRGTEEERRARWKNKARMVREQKKARGECMYCARPAEPGKSMCIMHADNARIARGDKLYGPGVREAVFERDGYRCVLGCNRIGRPLHLHHIDGRGHRSPHPNNDMDNLVTLCDSCHRRIEDLLNMRADPVRVMLLLQRKSPIITHL